MKKLYDVDKEALFFFCKSPLWEYGFNIISPANPYWSSAARLSYRGFVKVVVPTEKKLSDYRVVVPTKMGLEEAKKIDFEPNPDRVEGG